jgi:predicted SAM-dependent methyltransferase
MTWLRALRSSFPFAQLTERYAFASFARQAERNGALRLNLGCGPRLLAGWVNVDANIRPGVLTVRPAGLAPFYRRERAVHLRVHLPRASRLSSSAPRICRQTPSHPGARLRLVVPGIERIIRAYAADNQAFFAIQQQVHPDWCTTKLEHLMYALQQDGEHQYGYDFETLHKLLARAGFASIVPSDYNASQFEALRVDSRAIRDDSGAYLSLFVDAIK